MEFLIRILQLLPSLSWALALPRPETPLDCPTLLYSPSLASLSPSFPGVVAHGIHSLTLPDIRRYFPTASKEIRMPVVNPDLLSLEPIIFTPPDFNHTFTSPAMEAVDRVLSHMNSPHYDMRLYTDLEKLVHAAHMQDVWEAAGRVYGDIQASAGVSQALCHCIKDVEANGVIRMLRLIALKLREPGLMYGEHSGFIKEEPESLEEKKLGADIKQKTGKKVNGWDGNLYRYHFVDTDKETEKAALSARNGNDWSGNLYNYRFVDMDKEAEKAADGVQKKTATKVNDWSGNLYTYHFIDKDDKTEKAAVRIKMKAVENIDKSSMESDSDKGYDEDEAVVKPLPHLRSSEDWNTWKTNMKTMIPHMEEYSKYLAMYMYCMLN